MVHTPLQRLVFVIQNSGHRRTEFADEKQIAACDLIGANAPAALGGRTPAEAYRGETPVDMMDKPLRALPTSPQAQQQQQEDRFKGILAA